MAEQSQLQVPIRILSAKSDLLIALGVIGIVGVMIIPLPPLMLDFLLSFDIALSVVILLSALYTLDPLEFSVFPSLLLLATLFRLSLNVASTRLILLHGENGVEAAGKVIMAFGSFVIGGNYVVGLLVFFILVLINFIVITRGAERTAEVSARFTLDAMPGKQMSIDADLNAGLINEEQARLRRLKISQEAEFYGSMDGASKFVKGDAIAGMVITFINIVGGLVIGVLQKGMSVSEAATTYIILTVGDGLVSQIPALIVSTASGIIVTRAISESNIGQEMTKQLLIHPKAIGLTSAILFCFGLVPGLPTFSFLSLSAASAILAYSVYKVQIGETKKAAEEFTAKPAPSEAESKLISLVEPLGLEVGLRLIPLIDLNQHGEILDRITAIRKQYASEMGFAFPAVRIRDNLRLDPNSYSILIKGVSVAQGSLMPGHCLAMNTDEQAVPIEGIPTRDPTFGLPALWIPEKDTNKARALGYTVVDLSTVVATHFKEIVRMHSHEILSRQDVQTMLDTLAESHPKVVEEVTPALLPLGTIQKVLQNLLKEQIPVRDLVTIIETLGDYGRSVKDPDLLTEYVRGRLARTISSLYQDEAGIVSAFILDQKIEDLISRSVQHTDQGSHLAMNPALAQQIIARIGEVVTQSEEGDNYPILLCSGTVRRYVRGLTERFVPKLVVLAYHEIADNVKLQSRGVVELGDAN
ncbi:MAG: flagellar biosynthesis protein FlhA [bacterium]|nr:flagellar biosynthesis protein FlhA [bacterium]